MTADYVIVLTRLLSVCTTMQAEVDNVVFLLSISREVKALSEILLL